MRRQPVIFLAMGLMVGGAIGYAYGCGSARAVKELPDLAPTEVATAPAAGPLLPPAASQSDLDQLFPVQHAVDGWLQTTPSGVKKGMSRAEAAKIVEAEGLYASPEEAAVAGYAALFPAGMWHERQPWKGGYHHVSICFDRGIVAEVNDLRNDP